MLFKTISTPKLDLEPSIWWIVFTIRSKMINIRVIPKFSLYHQCIADLEPILGRKRAKESARFFKTYNSQIQADIMFNMRSFANFQKLRNSEHAQLEIRKIAAIMLELIENIKGQPFKHTLKSFQEKNNGL